MRITVTKVPLRPATPLTGVVERNDLVVYVVEVISGFALWREEMTDPERVRAFIRGAKAGAAGAGSHVHVEEPEWNV